MLSSNPDQVHLSVVREPGEAYQASPGKKRERRYRIQPPPKIVLEVEGDDSKCNWLENPRTFLMARLPAKPSILFGKTVESIQRVGDQAVFVFPDLSCQESGEHQLQFTLFSRDSDSEPAYVVKHIDSQPFVVVANRSARRRSEREKNTPLLRHSQSSRESLRDHVRLQPRKKSESNKSRNASYSTPSNSNKASPKTPTVETAQMMDISDSPSDTSPTTHGIFLSPQTPSPAMLDATYNPLYSYLSTSSPEYVDMFTSPLGICGLDGMNDAPSQATMPFTTAFSTDTFPSLPLTPCDSMWSNGMSWCMPGVSSAGSGLYEADPFGEYLHDGSDSPAIWTQSSPFGSVDVQSHSIPLLQSQWGTSGL